MFKFDIKNVSTSCKIPSLLLILNILFYFEHICPYVFNIDFEHGNHVKNRSALKIVLLMRTNTRGHTTAQAGSKAGFVSESLFENSGGH